MTDSIQYECPAKGCLRTYGTPAAARQCSESHDSQDQPLPDGGRVSRADTITPQGGPPIDYEVVNVVGVGALDGECDLEAVASDLQFDGTIEHKPARGSLHVRTDDGMIIAWRSGSYTVRGTDSERGCHELDHRWQTAIGQLDDSLPGGQPLAIKNVVLVADLHQSINLNAVSIALGFEASEYEPEQFPGLFWTTDDATVIVFASGRAVSVGAGSTTDALAAIEDLNSALRDGGLRNWEPSHE